MQIIKNGKMELIVLRGFEKNEAWFLRLSDNELIFAYGCVWNGFNVTWHCGNYRGHIASNIKPEVQ